MAATTRTVTGTIYDETGTAWASQSVVFRILTAHATAADGSVVQKTYTATTDSNGDFSTTLAVPAADGWLYGCKLPDGQYFEFVLEAGSATTLNELQADANLSGTVSASAVSDLITAHSAVTTGVHGIEVDGTPADNELLAWDTTAGKFINQTALEAGLSGGVSVLDDLTDVTIDGTPAEGEVLTADGADGWRNETLTEAGILGLAGGTMTGDITMADNDIIRPVIKDYGETTSIDTDSGATHTIDLENGNVHKVTLTAGCTFTFSNPPASGTAGSFTLILLQDGSGSHATTWPASVAWSSGGTAPTLTTTAGAVDILTFVTVDAGTTWYGFAAGLDMQLPS